MFVCNRVYLRSDCTDSFASWRGRWQQSTLRDWCIVTSSSRTASLTPATTSRSATLACACGGSGQACTPAARSARLPTWRPSCCVCRAAKARWSARQLWTCGHSAACTMSWQRWPRWRSAARHWQRTTRRLCWCRTPSVWRCVGAVGVLWWRWRH